MTPTTEPATDMDTDDVLQFALLQGPLRGQVASDPEPEAEAEELPVPGAPARRLPPPPETAGPPGAPAWPLPAATTEVLDRTPFPGWPGAARPALPATTGRCARLGHALLAAFGLVRREPSGLYNDHRGLASVRCAFPVHVFVGAGADAWELDVHRRALRRLTPGEGRPGERDELQVVLAGRYTDLPAGYGRLRGPLTEIEVGVHLRALLAALDLFGLPARVDPAAAPGRPLAGRLAPAGGWSRPVIVSLPADGRPVAAGPPAGEGGGPVGHHTGDSTLAEIVAVGTAPLRSPAVVAAEMERDSAPRAAALPPAWYGPRRSWAEVLWDRTSGRMPRNLGGMVGRRAPVPGEVLEDAVAWATVPAPSPALAAVAGHLGAVAFVQDVDGWAPGRYRLTAAPGTGGAAAGRPPVRLERQPDRGDGDPFARLEALYGYSLTPGRGCPVGQANVLWFLTADVRALLAEHGPGAWSLLQVAAGWIGHALTLAAAGHGLYARPARAFADEDLPEVMPLGPETLMVLAVICGVGRFTEPMLDLRN